MNEDRQFARLLGMMREQGSKDNPITLELGEMTSPTTCSIGELELDEEDLLFNERLLKPVLTKLDFEIQSNGGISHTHSWVDKCEYIEPLKKGDMVAVMRVMGEDGEDQEVYVVLCKVVSAE